MYFQIKFCFSKMVVSINQHCIVIKSVVFYFLSVQSTSLSTILLSFFEVPQDFTNILDDQRPFPSDYKRISHKLCQQTTRNRQCRYRLISKAIQLKYWPLNFKWAKALQGQGHVLHFWGYWQLWHQC